MVYPSKIIPQKKYKKLPSDYFLQSGYYIIRHTNSKDILDNLSQVKVKAVCEPRVRIIGLSVNLMGHYRVVDSQINVLSPEYHQDWPIGTLGKKPSKNEFFIDNKRGVVFIRFEAFHNYPFDYTHSDTSENYNFYCRLDHCPTLCNYWHFEVNWYSVESQEKLVVNKGKVRGVPKQVLTTMRNLIKEHAKINKPKSFKKTPVRIYK